MKATSGLIAAWLFIPQKTNSAQEQEHHVVIVGYISQKYL